VLTSGGSNSRPASGRSATIPGVRELPIAGGYRVFYKVETDTGRDETAGDVRVLRVYGPGQDRRGFRTAS